MQLEVSRTQLTKRDLPERFRARRAVTIDAFRKRCDCLDDIGCVASGIDPRLKRRRTLGAPAEADPIVAFGIFQLWKIWLIPPPVVIQHVDPLMDAIPYGTPPDEQPRLEIHEASTVPRRCTLPQPGR